MTPGRNADTIWLVLVVDETGSVSLGLWRIGSDGTASFLIYLCIRTMDLQLLVYPPGRPCFAIPEG